MDAKAQAVLRAAGEGDAGGGGHARWGSHGDGRRRCNVVKWGAAKEVPAGVGWGCHGNGWGRRGEGAQHGGGACVGRTCGKEVVVGGYASCVD